MTGCAYKSAPKPSKSPQVTIDSASVTQDLTPKGPDPISDPQTPSNPKSTPKQPKMGPKTSKTTPIPSRTTRPKAAEFGVPIPWEETHPTKLAAPWTSIPPALTSTTIAIVELDPHSILVAAERGLTRTAVVIPGINGYRLERGMLNGQLVDRLFVTCPNGGELWAGWFAAVRTWNSQQHPSTYMLFPLSTSEPDCSLLSNTD